MGQKNPAKIIPNLEVEGIGHLVSGLRVEHPKLGAGEVEELYELEDGSNTIRVKFDTFGSKALIPEYANLSRESTDKEEPLSDSVLSKLKGLFK
jgi:hypothetical protein